MHVFFMTQFCRNPRLARAMRGGRLCRRLTAFMKFDDERKKIRKKKGLVNF